MAAPVALKELMKQTAGMLGVPVMNVSYTVNYAEEERRVFDIERLCYKNLEKVSGYTGSI